MGFKESLHGANHLAAGGLGLEHLPHKTLEGQSQAKDSIAAVGTLVLRSQKVRRNQFAQLLGERREIQMAQRLEVAAALGGQLSPQSWEEGSGSHRAVYIPLY